MISHSLGLYYGSPVAFVRFGSERMYPVGSRQRLCLADGTNAVFDLYLDPVGGDPLLHSTMIVLIPGISNHSGTDYVRAYIEYASGQGFKVACLNHIGMSVVTNISIS